jgi:uncharacterized protein
MTVLLSFLVGLLFGLGLIVSSIMSPAKVLAFLDVAGAWDPSLGLVMLGAVAVGIVGFAFADRRSKSLLGLPMQLPRTSTIDRRLIGGSLLFGAGWGLVGFCPGPALVALGAGHVKALVFVLAMIAGMALFEFAELRSRPHAGESHAA